MLREGEHENKQQSRASEREAGGPVDGCVGVFIGGMRGEINKRGEKKPPSF